MNFDVMPIISPFDKTATMLMPSRIENHIPTDNSFAKKEV